MGSYNLANQDITSYTQLRRIFFDKYAYTKDLALVERKPFSITLQGYGNVMIDRAGAILLNKDASDVYAILAVDRNSQTHHAQDGKLPWSAWFSGGSNKQDDTVIDTIMREVFEESSGTIALSDTTIMEALNRGDFIYDNGTLAVILPNIYNISVQDMETAKDEISNNSLANYSMREMYSYHSVNILELINMTNKVAANLLNNPHDNAYNVRDIEYNLLRVDRYAALNLTKGVNLFKNIANRYKNQPF